MLQVGRAAQRTASPLWFFISPYIVCVTQLHHTLENRIYATLAESHKDRAQAKPPCVAKPVRWGASAMQEESPDYLASDVRLPVSKANRGCCRCGFGVTKSTLR
ncbi:MAG: hypothetical protein KME57_07090 [Scytonema hyalinum WJT4-NPBG1]|nr:hypothetical protein [Scytonema hyalinum WJT4-NPBG1]